MEGKERESLLKEISCLENYYSKESWERLAKALESVKNLHDNSSKTVFGFLFSRFSPAAEINDIADYLEKPIPEFTSSFKDKYDYLSGIITLCKDATPGSLESEVMKVLKNFCKALEDARVEQIRNMSLEQLTNILEDESDDRKEDKKYIVEHAYELATNNQNKENYLLLNKYSESEPLFNFVKRAALIAKNLRFRTENLAKLVKEYHECAVKYFDSKFNELVKNFEEMAKSCPGFVDDELKSKAFQEGLNKTKENMFLPVVPSDKVSEWHEYGDSPSKFTADFSNCEYEKDFKCLYYKYAVASPKKEDFKKIKDSSETLGPTKILQDYYVLSEEQKKEINSDPRLKKIVDDSMSANRTCCKKYIDKGKECLEKIKKAYKGDQKLIEELLEKLDKTDLENYLANTEKLDRYIKGLIFPLNDEKKLETINAVITEISSLQSGELPEKIVEVRNIYNKLNQESKEYISNYDDLINVEESISGYKDAKGKLEKIKNEFKNIGKFSGDFDNKLLEGLELCKKIDTNLTIDIASPLNESTIGILRTVLNKGNLLDLSENYLYFIIDQINVKKYFGEGYKDNTVKVSDESFGKKLKEKRAGLDKTATSLIAKTNGKTKLSLCTLKALFKNIDYCLKKRSWYSSDDSPQKVVECLQELLPEMHPWDQKKWKISVNFNSIDQLDELCEDLCDELTVNSKMSEEQKNKFNAVASLCEQFVISEKIRCDENFGQAEDDYLFWKIDGKNPSINIDDVKQKDLGICWLFAVLHSLIQSNKKQCIVDCFPNRGSEVGPDGKLKGKTITVRLWRIMLSAHYKGADKRYYARSIGKYIDITMDATIQNACRNGMSKPGSNLYETDTLWPEFIIKAISIARSMKDMVLIDPNVEDENLKVQLNTAKCLWCKEDFYWKSSEGGISDGIGYTMITGESSGGKFWGMKANARTLNYIKEKFNKHEEVKVSWKEIFTAQTDGVEVRARHAYSLVNIDEKNGTLTFLNPHNDKTKKGGEKVTITDKEFVKYFNNIEKHRSKS